MLANRFRAGLGLEPSNSAIVFCDIEDAADQLERAGIRAAVARRRLRTSWHVYNTDTDVDRTLDVLSRLSVAPSSSSSQLDSLTRGRPSRLAARALVRVDRLPARVHDGLDAALGEEILDRSRRTARGSRPARASSSRSSTVSVASFLFVPMTPVGPRLIQPAQ